MAILATDYMDFGNGIIGDDTFDVWRKKTNRIQVNLDNVNASLTSTINTKFSTLPNTYIAIAGGTTAVTTPLSFNSATQFPNATTTASSVKVGTVPLYEFNNKLQIEKEVNATALTSTKVSATSQIHLGTKTYNVPPAPAQDNLVLVGSQSNSNLVWKNPTQLFADAGGLQQTTTVFEEVMPVGSIIAIAGTIVDNNFLACEGGEVLQDDFPDLYALPEFTNNASNTNNYGQASDNTKFKLPNLVGRVAVGIGSAGGFNFGSDYGAFGGDGNSTTADHTLTIEQIPSHTHPIRDSNLVGTDRNTFAYGDAGGVEEGLPNLPNNTGGDSEGNTVPHSHTISPENRLQPYITVKYFIKAKKNTKIDFKIDLSNSGLTSTTAAGSTQTQISPVNETVTLKINPNPSAFEINSSGQFSFKNHPGIPGSLTLSGSDLRINSTTRIGSAVSIPGGGDVRRALVLGDGASEPATIDAIAGTPSIPSLNQASLGQSRQTMFLLRDEHQPAPTSTGIAPFSRGTPTGKGGNNDTLQINYSQVAPSAIGDYTGGVIINGTRSIAYKDGTVSHSARPIGPVKKLAEVHSGFGGNESGTGSSGSGGGAIGFIDHDGVPVFCGHSRNGKNNTPRFVRSGGTSTGGATDSYQNGYFGIPLPDDEKADKLYMAGEFNVAISESKKIFGIGKSSYFCSQEIISSTQTTSGSANEVHMWTRSMISDDSVKFSKVATYPGGYAPGMNALDENGILWTAGSNWFGESATGVSGTASNVYSTYQIHLQTTPNTTGNNVLKLYQKRDAIAASVYGYTGTDGTQVTAAHVNMPMKDSSGNLLTYNSDQSNQSAFDTMLTNTTGFYTTFTDVVCHRHTILGLGTDGRVYSVGWNYQGTCGDGTTGGTNHNTGGNWKIVKTNADTDLTNVTKIFIGGGYNSNGKAFAITADGDVYAWGDGTHHSLGNSTNVNAYATKVYDGTANGPADKVYTTPCGDSSDNVGSTNYIVTNEDQPRFYVTGKGNHFDGGKTGSIEDVVYTTFTNVSNGCWNTSTHTVEKLFQICSTKGHSNQQLVIAKNIATGKRELWANGYGGTTRSTSSYRGDCLGLGGSHLRSNAGAYFPANSSNYSGTDSNGWLKVRVLPPGFVDKIVNIRIGGYDNGANATQLTVDYFVTHIHLSDGSLYGSGFGAYNSIINDPWQSYTDGGTIQNYDQEMFYAFTKVQFTGLN